MQSQALDIDLSKLSEEELDDLYFRCWVEIMERKEKGISEPVVEILRGTHNGFTIAKGYW